MAREENRVVIFKKITVDAIFRNEIPFKARNILKLIKTFTLLICLIPLCYANEYLMKPTGSYGVGFQDVSLINTAICPDGLYKPQINEKDFSANNKKHCHEIFLRVYYPLSRIPKVYDQYYTPFLISLNNWIIKKLDLSKRDAIQLSSVLKIKSYSKENVNLIAHGKFPIIIFIPGSGSSAQIYTNLITNLVSHEYIVIGVNSMFISGPLQRSDGHIIEPPNSYLDTIGREENIKDLEFTSENLNKLPLKFDLKNHMNFNFIGLLGHSRGAMSIVHFINQNSINKSFRAIVLMDPGTGLGKKNYPLSLPNIPTLVLWSSKFKNEMEGSTLAESNVQNIILQNNQENIEYSNHNNFCDFSTLQYHPAYSNLKIRNELTVGIGDGYQIAGIINQKILSFFNIYLKQR